LEKAFWKQHAFTISRARIHACLFIGRIDEDRTIEGCEGLDERFREQ
jgi:hypothetical protein